MTPLEIGLLMLWGAFLLLIVIAMVGVAAERAIRA
jgi:hypothetical protein